MSYKYVPDKVESNYPARLQAIVDEYERHNLEFTFDPDADVESAKEILYERWARQKPDKTWMELLAVYRLKDEFSGEEFMIYKIKKHVPDNNEQDIAAEIWMGKRVRFDTRNVLDTDGNVINKNISRWNMVYTMKWDKKEFDRLMKESRNKRVPLYIAYTSDEYHTNFTGNSIMIRNEITFRDSSFDELLAFDERLKTDRLTNQVHQAAGKPNA